MKQRIPSIDRVAANMQALQDAFHDLHGLSDSALVREVADKARQRFGFCGDDQAAIELLNDSFGFKVSMRRDPRTGQVDHVVRCWQRPD